MGRPHNQRIRSSDLRGAVNGRLTDAGYRQLWDILSKANLVLRQRCQRLKKREKKFYTEKFRRAHGLCDGTQSLQQHEKLRRGNRSMQNLEGVVDSLDPRLVELIHQAIDDGLFAEDGDLNTDELVKFQRRISEERAT